MASIDDIDTAVLANDESLKRTPKGHPSRPKQLTLLGYLLGRRFELLGNMSDIDRAISTLEEAVELIPEGHLDQPGLRSNLGGCLQARFKRLGNVADIDRAISTLEETIELTTNDHPHRPTFLSNLGNSPRTRFEHLGKMTVQSQPRKRLLSSFPRAILTDPGNYRTLQTAFRPGSSSWETWQTLSVQFQS